jgi:hypothetical protein
VILYLEQWQCDLDSKHDELKIKERSIKAAFYFFAKQTNLVIN